MDSRISDCLSHSESENLSRINYDLLSESEQSVLKYESELSSILSENSSVPTNFCLGRNTLDITTNAEQTSVDESANMQYLQTQEPLPENKRKSDEYPAHNVKRHKNSLAENSELSVNSDLSSSERDVSSVPEHSENIFKPRKNLPRKSIFPVTDADKTLSINNSEYSFDFTKSQESCDDSEISNNARTNGPRKSMFFGNSESTLGAEVSEIDNITFTKSQQSSSNAQVSNESNHTSKYEMGPRKSMFVLPGPNTSSETSELGDITFSKTLNITKDRDLMSKKNYGEKTTLEEKEMVSFQNSKVCDHIQEPRKSIFIGKSNSTESEVDITNDNQQEDSLQSDSYANFSEMSSFEKSKSCVLSQVPRKFIFVRKTINSTKSGEKNTNNTDTSELEDVTFSKTLNSTNAGNIMTNENYEEMSSMVQEDIVVSINSLQDDSNTNFSEMSSFEKSKSYVKKGPRKSIFVRKTESTAFEEEMSMDHRETSVEDDSYSEMSSFEKSKSSVANQQPKKSIFTRPIRNESNGTLSDPSNFDFEKTKSSQEMPRKSIFVNRNSSNESSYLSDVSDFEKSKSIIDQKIRKSVFYQQNENELNNDTSSEMPNLTDLDHNDEINNSSQPNNTLTQSRVENNTFTVTAGNNDTYTLKSASHTAETEVIEKNNETFTASNPVSSFDILPIISSGIYNTKNSDKSGSENSIANMVENSDSSPTSERLSEKSFISNESINTTSEGKLKKSMSSSFDKSGEIVKTPKMELKNYSLGTTPIANELQPTLRSSLRRDSFNKSAKASVTSSPVTTSVKSTRESSDLCNRSDDFNLTSGSPYLTRSQSVCEASSVNSSNNSNNRSSSDSNSGVVMSSGNSLGEKVNTPKTNDKMELENSSLETTPIANELQPTLRSSLRRNSFNKSGKASVTFSPMITSVKSTRESSVSYNGSDDFNLTSGSAYLTRSQNVCETISVNSSDNSNNRSSSGSNTGVVMSTGNSSINRSTSRVGPNSSIHSRKNSMNSVSSVDGSNISTNLKSANSARVEVSNSKNLSTSHASVSADNVTGSIANTNNLSDTRSSTQSRRKKQRTLLSTSTLMDPIDDTQSSSGDTGNLTLSARKTNIAYRTQKLLSGLSNQSRNRDADISIATPSQDRMESFKQPLPPRRYSQAASQSSSKFASSRAGSSSEGISLGTPDLLDTTDLSLLTQSQFLKHVNKNSTKISSLKTSTVRKVKSSSSGASVSGELSGSSQTSRSKTSSLSNIDISSIARDKTESSDTTRSQRYSQSSTGLSSIPGRGTLLPTPPVAERRRSSLGYKSILPSDLSHNGHPHPEDSILRKILFTEDTRLNETSSPANSRSRLDETCSTTTSEAPTRKPRKANDNRLDLVLDNGEIYKPKPLFKHKRSPWIHKRLYKYLDSKLRPKYKLKTRLVSEFCTKLLHEKCEELRQNRYARHDNKSKAILEYMKNKLVGLGVIDCNWDFFCFSKDYLPLIVSMCAAKNISAKGYLNRLEYVESEDEEED